MALFGYCLGVCCLCVLCVCVLYVYAVCDICVCVHVNVFSLTLCCMFLRQCLSLVPRPGVLHGC